MVLLIGLLSPWPDLSDAVVLLPFVGHDGVGGEAGEQGIGVMGIGCLHIGSDGLRELCLHGVPFIIFLLVVRIVPKIRLERVKSSEWFPRR